MSHRLQITLTDVQYEHLRSEARKSGASIAELVRRRLDGGMPQPDLRENIIASAGAWPDAPDGEQFVERVRRGAEARRARFG